MRKTITILAVAFATLGTISTSCSSSDNRDEQISPKYNVTGTWNLTTYKDQNGNWKDMSVLKYYVQFNSDKSYKTNYLGTILSGTYTYNGNDQIIATTSAGKAYLKINSMNGNNAEAEMYNENIPNDKIIFKLQKQ